MRDYYGTWPEYEEPEDFGPKFDRPPISEEPESTDDPADITAKARRARNARLLRDEYAGVDPDTLCDLVEMGLVDMGGQELDLREVELRRLPDALRRDLTYAVVTDHIRRNSSG